MKPDRNEPCPCGSGKKYKHCCERKTSPTPVAGSPSLTELNQLIALFNAGRLIEAEQQSRSLTEKFPTLAVAWKLLGVCLNSQGKAQEALPALLRATELLPDDAEAHYNLGVTQVSLGQLDDAVTSYRKSLTLKPDDAATHNNLGNTLRELGRFDEAVASCRRALEINPDYAGACLNLGSALKELGRRDEAMDCFRRALAINPNFAEAHNYLGICFHTMKQLDSAVKSFQQALQINPDDVEALNNLGLALHDLGRVDEGILNCRRALEINPNYAEAHTNLGLMQTSLGKVDDAQASFLNALRIKPSDFNFHTSLLFSRSYTSTSPSDYLTEALHYGASVARKVPARFTAWQCNPQPQKLRIGLVSGDFRNHVVAFFLESLLAQLNSARIELIAYTSSPIEDDLTLRIKPHFAHWREIYALNDPAAAGLIHSDGVHILIDLSGHTSHNRLPVFAWKPAPVQCTWLGYFATTGVDEIDYLLADETGVPENQRTDFSETIWYLPDTRLCFTPPDTELPVAPLPGLSNGQVTFGCYQNLAKVNDQVLAVWGRIFAELPQARLRLACKQLGDASVAARLTERLQQQGIAANRVDMQGSVSRQNYLVAHAGIDILLDTFPYPGGTTTCEGLWMGVPTLTLAGNTLLSRQGVSLLKAAGLPDWIARDEADYVAKAISFAGDLPKLSALRGQLREQVRTSPLFDAPRFAQHFEAALWGMWQANDIARVELTPYKMAGTLRAAQSNLNNLQP